MHRALIAIPMAAVALVGCGSSTSAAAGTSSSSTTAASPHTVGGVALDHGRVPICAPTTNPKAPYRFAERTPGVIFAGTFHHGPVWHEGVRGPWGAIIPPFSTAHRSFPGYNWHGAPPAHYGAPIWDNNCQLP